MKFHAVIEVDYEVEDTKEPNQAQMELAILGDELAMSDAFPPNAYLKVFLTPAGQPTITSRLGKVGE